MWGNVQLILQLQKVPGTACTSEDCSKVIITLFDYVKCERTRGFSFRLSPLCSVQFELFTTKSS